MQTSQAESHEISHPSQRRLFVCGFCTAENVIRLVLVLVPHSPLPLITATGPFLRIFTLRFLPMVTMNDHPYPSVSASGSPILTAIYAFVSTLSFCIFPLVLSPVENRNSTPFVETLLKPSTKHDHVI